MLSVKSKKLQMLLERNKKWASGKVSSDSEYFLRHKNAENPEILWIGCSDSRVLPNQILQLPIGEIAVHRNIANIIRADDNSLLSVLHYSINTLDIENIIICGHSGCGGVKAACSDQDIGPLRTWLSDLRELYEENVKDLKREGEIHNTMAVLNVLQQVAHLENLSVVQKAIKSGKNIRIFGLIYDLKSGELRLVKEAIL